METQRLFLVIALVFVMFLIWQAWIEEQAAKIPPPTVTTPAPGVPAPGVPAPGVPATGTPAAGEPGQEAVPDREDVPDVALPGEEAPTAEPVTRSAERIKVITDEFVAEIDPVGGSLVHVGLRNYPESLEHKDQPFALLADNRSRLFVAQSGLKATAGSAPDHYARFVAGQSEYRLQEGQDSLEVPLIWENESGIKVTKTYTFHRDSFAVDVTHRVENASSEGWRGSQYRQFQRMPPVESSSALGVYTYTGGVISTQEKNYEKIGFDDMAEENLNREEVGGWIAMIQHYFLSAWVPEQDETNVFYSRAPGGNRYVLGMVGLQQTVAPGESGEFHTRLYAGPKIQDNLEQLAPNLRLTVDYGFLTIIAQPLFWLLKTIHGVVGNWGWSIVILTMLIKAVFFKLSETSYKSMANMRRMAPQIQKLKDRYGSDRQKMNQAMMELYKKEKINPLGGCLPIVVQIPVFIALYWMLLESVELRQAPWILWIQDLSTKDPFYVLPLIMGASMFIQQKLNPPPPDPIQAKVMMALPLVFTIFFLWFPAGLVLYWVVNNVLSIAQQYIITKRVEAATAKA